MSNLFISPHNDDETLFGAFTLCREAADIQVVVVFDGHVQASRGEPVTWVERRLETEAALRELGVVKKPAFAGFRDDAPNWGMTREYVGRLVNKLSPGKIYAPYPEVAGHDQHNNIGRIATAAAREQDCSLIPYLTYTTQGKSTRGNIVEPEPDHIIRKLRALACYKSQITVVNCREHFMRGLHEYYA